MKPDLIFAPATPAKAATSTIRHMYTSLLIAHGAHPKYIQAQPGPRLDSDLSGLTWFGSYLADGSHRGESVPPLPLGPHGRLPAAERDRWADSGA